MPNSVRQRAREGLWESVSVCVCVCMCLCVVCLCFKLWPLAVTPVLITLQPEQPQALLPLLLLQPSSSLSPFLSHSCSLCLLYFYFSLSSHTYNVFPTLPPTYTTRSLPTLLPLAQGYKLSRLSHTLRITLNCHLSSGLSLPFRLLEVSVSVL